MKDWQYYIMNNSRYYWAAIVAFSIWGFFSFVLKPLEQYPSMDILFYRVFICSGIMIAISSLIRTAILRKNISIFKTLTVQQKKTVCFQIVGCGLLLATNWFVFIFVMNHVSLKAASFAYLVCPILTTLLAALLLKEKLSAWQWVAVGLSVTSCIILGFSSLLEMFYSIVIGLSYALYIIVQPKENIFDKFLILTLQIVCAGLFILPFYPSWRGPAPEAPLFYAIVGIIAVFFTIAPLMLNLYALKGLKSSVVGILMYINPLITFMLAVMYYHETVDAGQAVAYSVIGMSVIIFNLTRKKEPASVS